MLQRDSEHGTQLSDHSLQVIFSGYATRPKDGVPCPELSPLDARPVVGPGGSQEGECDCQVHFSGLRRSHRATETDSCFRLSSELSSAIAGAERLNQKKPEDLSLRNRALRPRACKQYQSNNYEKRIVSVVVVDTDADTSLVDVC